MTRQGGVSARRRRVDVSARQKVQGQTQADQQASEAGRIQHRPPLQPPLSSSRLLTPDPDHQRSPSHKYHHQILCALPYRPPYDVAIIGSGAQEVFALTTLIITPFGPWPFQQGVLRHRSEHDPPPGSPTSLLRLLAVTKESCTRSKGSPSLPYLTTHTHTPHSSPSAPNLSLVLRQSSSTLEAVHARSSPPADQLRIGP